MESTGLTVIVPTKAIKKDYKRLISSARKAIEDYRNFRASLDMLKKRLLAIIDELPVEAYADVDLLECYDIESDKSLWIRPDSDIHSECISNLKELIEEMDFNAYSLSFDGSASVLRTIFGETYQLYLNGEL